METKTFKAPAITVVGEVVTLRSELRWFDNRPLFGRGIMVTRAVDQAGEFSELLAGCGARVFECPTIRIVPPETFSELDEAIGNLSSFDWMIFTSFNGVSFFCFRRTELRSLSVARILHSLFSFYSPVFGEAFGSQYFTPESL